jgi:hypothetical protein
MAQASTTRRPWLLWGAIALLGLVVGGWSGFLLGRVSTGWRLAPKHPVFTALPGLDWKKAAADAGVTGWTGHVDFPDAAKMEERRQQLAGSTQGGVLSTLSAMSRFVLAQATIPKAEQDAFVRKFHEGIRENLRLQGLNVSSSVGGGSYQKRPNDRTKDVETKYEGFRYAQWSRDGTEVTVVGEGWIAVQFEGDVATVVLSLTEAHARR